MTEQVVRDPAPATETRGGESPDWDRAAPGEPLPEKTGEAARPASYSRVTDWCGDPRCGGD